MIEIRVIKLIVSRKRELKDWRKNGGKEVMDLNSPINILTKKTNKKYWQIK